MAVERKSLSILFLEISFAIAFVVAVVDAVIVVRFRLCHGVTRAQCPVYRKRMLNSIRNSNVNLVVVVDQIHTILLTY